MTINDTLENRIDSAKASAKQVLIDWLVNNTDHDPELTDIDLCKLNCSGALDEIYDSATPIYTKEIRDIWYLHGSRLEQAYEDSGLGENPLENYGTAAIYCLIEKEISEWLTENTEAIVEKFYKPMIESLCKEVDAAYDAYVVRHPEEIGSIELSHLDIESGYGYVAEQAENYLSELQGI